MWAGCFDIKQRFTVDILALPTSPKHQEIVHALPLMARSAARVPLTDGLAESACTLGRASIEHGAAGKRRCLQVAWTQHDMLCRSYLLLLLPVLHSPLLSLLWLLLLPLPLLLVRAAPPNLSLCVTVRLPGAWG